MERELRVPALACPPSVQLPFEYLIGNVETAGLDNGGPDIDGLDIAGLDIDGRMRGQLNELQNFTP